MKMGSLLLIVILETTTESNCILENITNGRYYCFSFFLYKSIHRERILQPMNPASVVYS